MDYYNVLGVSKSASQEEIKKAFHKLAHQHHPHKGGDEKKFKEINEAYQVLSDKEKRDQYDKFGRVFDGQNPNSGQGGAGNNWDFSWMWNGQNQQAEQEEDIDFDMGDIFGDFFGFSRTTSKKEARKGKDIEVDFEISLEDTLKEIRKRVVLSKMAVCQRCKGKGAEPGSSVKECFTCRGTGRVQQVKRTIFGQISRTAVCPECQGEGQKPEKLCNVCKGEGRIKEEEEIEINIPAGIDHNQIMKMAGKGEAGKKGGRAGDLYIRILIRKHPIYQRKGDDLYLDYPISFSQAALGDEAELLTLEKTKLILNIPAGSYSGKVLRISGKGIPFFSGYGRGDMYVKMIVEIPHKLTRKQKELLEKLKEEGL